MRILVIGEFAWDHQEPSFCRGLRAAGAQVEEVRIGGPRRALDSVRRAQLKYGFGPELWAYNAAFLAVCARRRPDFVLAWRPLWLRPAAIRAVHRLGSRVLLYNNDDPFGPDRQMPIWRAFRRLVPEADACFAYRAINVKEYVAAGASRVYMLRSYYDPAIHRPMTLSAAERGAFESDVTFVGHFEDDGRVEALDALMKAGLRVRVFGGGWQLADADPRLAPLRPIRAVHGDDYARALTATKIAIVFLSKRNRDQYTRRCFEIPAVGTLMLAPRTDELSALFAEDQQAAYFASPRELVEKARAYAADDERRQKIALAGHERCLRDGHDVLSRARVFLRTLDQLLQPGLPAMPRSDDQAGSV